MIRITSPNGQAHYLAAAAIAQVTEGGPSSQWHGIKAYVKTFDGRTIEAQEEAGAIAKMVAAATQQKEA